VKNQELIFLNSQGLIPGPNETQESYIKRVEYCKRLDEELIGLKEIEKTSSIQPLLKEAVKITRPLYGIAPFWIPVVYSNEQLSFWHGGCAWIFQMSESTPVGAFMQLKKKFKDNETLYGTYTRGELTAHELCHACRMAFNEPKFEEILAYRTSKSPFRKTFGPLFESASETLWFAIVLIFIFMLDFGLLYFGSLAGYASAMWLKSIPVIWLGYCVLRLFKKRRQFARTLNALKDIFGVENAEAVIYRMTDCEIVEFGKKTKDEQKRYLKEQQVSSFRWNTILTCYHHTFGL